MIRIIKKCKYCGKEFKTYLTGTRGGKRIQKFCKRECFYAWLRKVAETDYGLTEQQRKEVVFPSEVRKSYERKVVTEDD